MTVATKPFEPDDPLAPIGVAVDGGPDAAAEMARCLVEEYLREGWDEIRLLALFRNPFYQALHMIYQQRGEDGVRALIADVAATWGVWRMSETAGPEGGEPDA